MTNTYTIPTSECEKIEKAVAKYHRKALAYGCEFDAKFGDPYAKERKVFETVWDANGIPAKVEVGTQLIEVFDVEISSEPICKAGYEVVAKIEHLKDGNIVSVFGDERKQEWSEIKPRCQHCGGNHGQKVTFIVRHEDGSELQVGRTCLKDYCGIDPQQIAYLNQLRDLLLDEDVDHHDFNAYPVPNAYAVLEILALAILVMKKQGYVKTSEQGSNCEVIAKLLASGYKPSEKELDVAYDLMNKICLIDHGTAWAWNLDNVQNLLRSGYCKGSHFGYIAYAPLAYKRYEEKLERERAKEAENAEERRKSEHVGQVGQRIVIDVAEMNLITSWETQYGVTHLYKIVDEAGNVFVWFASKCMESASKIKATIKEHSERDGVKQTVVTRCAVA